ncbi:nucleotidyl transferase AbiEii/AbiGii toxin family protein [Kribbella sp. NPDC048915]|uniref:nucleotidyl transferase AbiEii/AbiGii toxin family protein n=1 Tax=Kribbella sp. NPDC048915 TaxID=3155148 RepID=UPI0033F92E97
MSTPRTPLNPAAIRRSLGDRLRAEAKRRGRPAGDLRREFVFQRFLGRVFSQPGNRWVLKGGTGLLVRLQEARYSKDIDLVVPGEPFDVDEAVEALRAEIRRDAGDHLTFAIDSATRPDDGQVAAMLKVTCYTGATPFERFTIDLSTRSHIIAAVDRIRPQPVLELADADPLPRFVLYPLPDQVADKLCAMYDHYGATGKPSTRYRDLVDLALIATTNELNATLTAQAITAEAARRDCALPPALETPGPEWHAGYPRAARDASLPTELQNLAGAIDAVGDCLNPVLAGTATGTWMPGSRLWKAAPDE